MPSSCENPETACLNVRLLAQFSPNDVSPSGCQCHGLSAVVHESADLYSMLKVGGGASLFPALSCV